MLWAVAAVIVLAVSWLYLVFPGRSGKEARALFARRAYAHRGLHTMDQSVPENSLPAFRLALEAGFGAELDVQMTKDGQVVVYHDDDLERGCGRSGRICDLSLAEVQTLKLFGTEERIPLFSEVLEVFDGKQPLIVELKTAPNRDALCEAVRNMLAAYPGPACVESFDPQIVRWFRRRDPERLRGQLAQAARSYRGGTSRIMSFALSRLLFNFAARPHFIAYGIGPKPVSARLCEALGAMKVCWTAREPDQHPERMQKNDAVIFEGYHPALNPSSDSGQPDGRRQLSPP